MTGTLDFIVPRWPAPASVRAFFTTRRGGVSAAPFARLNLGRHVGDEPDAVDENRSRVRETFDLPQEPRWLRQIHGAGVADAAEAQPFPEADASFSGAAGVVCAVLVADCLPLLLCDRRGGEVAAVHAGWRGLLAGVVQATVGRMAAAPSDILAWMGPAIGPEVFEVGPEVRQGFLAKDPGYGVAFRPSPRRGCWLADVYAMARFALDQAGVGEVHGAEWCTYSEPERFFSYRRDGLTGRMAALIWRDAEPGSGVTGQSLSKETG
jgi:purine-nucleoside/S-methyl-5'-thioadenosine phosphorylase / adenosine deaminase